MLVQTYLFVDMLRRRQEIREGSCSSKSFRDMLRGRQEIREGSCSSRYLFAPVIKGVMRKIGTLASP
jgi:hypothetical protein